MRVFALTFLQDCYDQITSRGYENTTAYRNKVAAWEAAGGLDSGRPKPAGSYKLCILVTDGANADAAKANPYARKIIAEDGFHIKGIITMFRLPTVRTKASALKKLNDVTSCNLTRINAFMQDHPDVADPARHTAVASEQRALLQRNQQERETCPYFTAADDFAKLEAKAADIAEALVGLVGVDVERTDVTCVCEAGENNSCPTDAAYFSFLLLAVPLLAYLFYKPLEYFFVAWYNQHVKGTERDCFAPLMRTACWTFLCAGPETEKVTVAAPPVPPKPAPAPPPPPEPKRPVSLPPQQGAEKKRFKWDLASSDRYLRGSGQAPMKVNWGALPAPPSAPKVDARHMVQARVLRIIYIYL